eukprot:2601300-Rhodomonas_salina.1
MSLATMDNTFTRSESFVPSHVQQWVREIEQAQNEAEGFEERQHQTSQGERAQREHSTNNDIEAEVIQGGRRRSSGEAFDDEKRQHSSSSGCSTGGTFARHMFENKKAHRVACLLASARLILSFAKADSHEEGLFPSADEDPVPSHIQ